MAADGDEIRVCCSSELPGDGTQSGDLRRVVGPSKEISPRMLTPGHEPSDGGGQDPMVKIELDAAHALAMMASSRLQHRRGGERKWGSRRHRTRERRRSAEIWGNSYKDFEMAISLQNVQPHLLSKQTPQPQKPCKPVIKKNVKIEQDPDSGSADESLKKIMRQAPLSRGKPKHQLSEAEKEERRLRRIQANRESARQTIRRRQALCEELTKKAANLSLENNSLKKEIESAMKEYILLVETNKRLKDQVTEADNDDSKDSPLQDVKGVVSIDELFKTENMMPSSMLFPLLVYGGTPFAQFAWPSMMPLDPIEQKPVLCEINNSAAYNPNPPNGCSGSVGLTGCRGQLLMLPCPLICSINNEAPCTLGSGSSSKGNDGSPRSPNNHQHGTDLSLKLARDVKPKALHGKANAYSSMDVKNENGADEFITTSSGSSTDGGNYISGFHSKALTLIPIFGATDPSAVNQESVGLAGSISREQVSSVASCSLFHSSAKIQDKHLYHKRLSDAAAATEARKRRKELTKLKSLHSRQLKLQC